MRVLLGRSGARLALALLTLLISTPAWAEEPVGEYEALRRASLKGLESVNVIVLLPKAALGCHSLSAKQLEAELLVRLQQAGLPIAPEAESYLLISISSVAAPKDLLCGFVVLAELQQAVVLMRDPHIVTFGGTWHESGQGLVGIAKYPEHLRALLASILDAFISVYLEQNPKK